MIFVFYGSAVGLRLKRAQKQGDSSTHDTRALVRSNNDHALTAEHREWKSPCPCALSSAPVADSTDANANNI